MITLFLGRSSDKKSASDARAMIINEWRPFFEKKSGDQIQFPALEGLRLDFTHIRVDNTKSVTVGPGTLVQVYLSYIFNFFITRFRRIRY